MIELLATSTIARSAFLIGVFALIAFASFFAINLAARQRTERRSLAQFVGDSPEVSADNSSETSG